MSFVMDLILIVIALVTIIRCWISGFAVSVLRFGRFFIALFGALLIGKGFVGCLVTFIVLFAAITVLISILKLVTKIPVIHGIDKLLGFILGVVCAAFYVISLSAAMHAILSMIDSVSSSSTAMAMYYDSVVFKFIYGIADKMNVFGRLGL